MPKPHNLFAAALAAVAGVMVAAARADEPKTWELRDGGQRWELVAAPTTQPATDETLDRVEQLLKQGQTVAGKRLCLYWFRTHKSSPIRDRAVYLLGQANYRLGELL